jgi:hypothetical protein
LKKSELDFQSRHPITTLPFAESLLPSYVSSGFFKTCTNILRDDHTDPHHHAPAQVQQAQQQQHTAPLDTWDGLVQEVMRVLLNVSVNDAGAILLLEQRERALATNGAEGVDCLGPIMTMARLMPPLESALSAAGNHNGHEEEAPLVDPFADPFKRKLWAWKVLGNLTGVKEGRAFLRQYADDLFFGGRHGLSLSDPATVRAIGSADHDEEVATKAKEVASYAARK